MDHNTESGEVNRDADIISSVPHTGFPPEGDSKRENKCELLREYNPLHAFWIPGPFGDGLEKDAEDHSGRYYVLVIYRNHSVRYIKRVF